MITEGGLWGKLTGVSVSIVSIFVIFGAFLNAGEAGQGFMNIAVAAAGRLKGGAAKVSVISSALFGSISGSASANVASTGMVTLPTMRRLGYPKHVAAAVEAVASTGGQIMPPLMGAGAFVMVELTGIPYNQIIVAALIPAILYFATIWIGVNRYAEIHNLKPYDQTMLPSAALVVKTSLFFFIPFTVLLFIMYTGYTPQFAAAVAISSAALLLLIDVELRPDLKRTLHRLCETALILRSTNCNYSRNYFMCITYRWCSWFDWFRNQGHFHYLNSFWRKLVARIIANCSCLHFIGNGGADHCCICDLCLSCRPGSD